VRIAVKDIPQADDLSDVVEVVTAVANGHTSYQDIAAVIGKVERQGRYYRRAAEILRFIGKRAPNTSELTPQGNAFLMASKQEKTELLIQAVLGATIFQRIIPFLESKLPDGCARTELESFVEAVTQESTKTMIHRRTSTIIAWLQAAHVIKEVNVRYVLQSLPASTGVVNYNSDTEPLLPTKFSLSEYIETAERISDARGFITSAVRQAQRERASNAHIRLTNLIAAKIRRTGAIPRQNRHIDLAAYIRQETFIFEVKSMTDSNAQAQIRRGVSQLYEYRYLQGVPAARLVLVIERPLPCSLAWMSDYLIQDRRILPVWDFDGDRLHCPPSVRGELSFLTL
jgi:hypothetical protein